MHFLRCIARVGEITQIGLVAKCWHEFREYIPVFLLKHLGKLAFRFRAFIQAVAIHMVDEEEAEHLDLLPKQLSLTLQVGADSLTNLNTAQVVFVDSTHGITLVQHQAIDKADGTFKTIDALHDEVVTILVQLSTLFIEIEAFAHHSACLLGARGSLHVIADTRLWVTLADDDFLQIDVAVGSRRAYLPDALHLNLLHEFLIIGIYGIQSEHHVVDVVLTVRGTIEQGEQGLELCQPLARLVALIHTQHTLRLIDDHDRVTLAEHIDRTAAAKLITPVEDDACCLVSPCALALFLVHRRVEGLRVDNHHVHTGIAGKGINLRELLGVIDEVLHALAVVFPGKVLLHALKALQHSFAYGDAGDHHHELRPAVTLVQLIHGLYIGIGLARTRFHLDGERHAHTLQVLQVIDRLQALFSLYGTHILADSFTGEHDMLVAETSESKKPLILALVNSVVTQPVTLRLTRESVGYSACGFGLESLMFISYLHGLYHSDVFDYLLVAPVQQLLEGLVDIDFVGIALEAAIAEDDAQRLLLSHDPHHIVRHLIGKASHQISFVDDVDLLAIHFFSSHWQ